MDEISTTTAANRGSKEIHSYYTDDCIIGQKPKNLPAYGKFLAGRQRWGNPPDFIYVCVGGDAFRSAQNHNKQPDTSALVLATGQDPLSLQWPVDGIPVIVEWDGSAPARLIQTLAKCLLKSGALSVAIYPTWVDYTTPAYCFDIAKKSFVQLRETIRIYGRRSTNVHA
jgi:hypothetical protein